MNTRTFLKSLLLLPFVTACHIPVVGNSPEEIKHRKQLKEETFNVGDKVLVIKPLQQGRTFDFGPGYVMDCNCGMGAMHPLGTYMVRFPRTSDYFAAEGGRMSLYASYRYDEIIKVK